MTDFTNFFFYIPLENRLYAYADGSTLLTVVRKPADRPSVALSHNRKLARIQEWCDNWCMILKTNKTKVLISSRSRTVNQPHGDFVLSGVSICASPNLYIHGVKFDSKVIFEDQVWDIVSRVSERIGILRLVGEVCLWGHLFVTLLLLCNCSPDPWIMFSDVAVLLNVTFSARAPDVFGGQSLSRSEFLVIVSSTSWCWTIYVVQG